MKKRKPIELTDRDVQIIRDLRAGNKIDRTKAAVQRAIKRYIKLLKAEAKHSSSGGGISR